MLASENGHAEISTLLIVGSVGCVYETGASGLIGRLDGGNTALLMACSKGHVDIVRLLLGRSDVDINAVNVST